MHVLIAHTSFILKTLLYTRSSAVNQKLCILNHHHLIIHVPNESAIGI